MDNQNKVVIYTIPWCDPCNMSKELLSSVDIDYQEINLGDTRLASEFLCVQDGVTIVPQVFIDGKLVTEFNELGELYNSEEFADLFFNAGSISFTVPQIFINGEFIGGFDKLNELHSNGEFSNLFFGDSPVSVIDCFNNECYR